MHAGLSCSSPALRSTLIVLLLILLAGSARAEGADLDARAGLLVQHLERELGRLQEETADFAEQAILRKQEHWYRPWQENAIVAAMDQALDASEDLLLTELLDPRGQLVAVNAHAGSGAPLASGDLYLEDFSGRPWFRAMADENSGATRRLDGPYRDSDVVRIYGEAFSPSLRVTVPLVAEGEIVALLSHCYREDGLIRLMDLALRDGEDRLPGELALFDGRGRLIAGRDPQSGGEDIYTSRAFPLEFAGGPTWTLRAFALEEKSATAALLAFLPSIGLLPTLAFALAACLITGLLMLVRLRRPVEKESLAPSSHARPSPKPLRKPTIKPLPRTAQSSVKPLLPAQKASEILNAALGAMLSTLHTLAEGSDELAGGSLNPIVAEGPGSTLGALRRVSGMNELFKGLERHVASCKEGASVSNELRQGVDLFGRIGRQMDKLVEPLLETERRLRGMPRISLRGPGEKHSFATLTGNLHALVGVLSALQASLGRLPQPVLRDEWSAADPSLRSWQESMSEIHDLLLLLAAQVGATGKVLELLPVSTDPVVEVEDISAKVMGVGSATATPRPVAREAVATASAGGRSFEILGKGGDANRETLRDRDRRVSSSLPSREVV